MFCFAKPKFLITPDNTAYLVSAFCKSLYPNHFATSDMPKQRYM